MSPADSPAGSPEGPGPARPADPGRGNPDGAGPSPGFPTRLALLGALEAGALLALGWMPGARATPLPALAVWALAFLAYLAAARAVGGRDVSRPLVWGMGVGMRVALLPLTPHFSDDIFRYLWDGWVQVQGVNPYAHAPADPALTDLRPSWHGRINHPEIPTIYPPGAQLAFGALARLAASIPLFKVAWVACDLAIAGVLSRLAADRAGAAAGGTALLLWLWSPLVVLEVAWSGHMEPLGILPMMLAVWWLGRDGRSDAPGRGLGRSLPGGAALGLAISVKFAPAAGLPALLRRRGWRPTAVALAVPALLAVPFLGAGSDLFSGLAAYAARWEFVPGLFRVLGGVVDGRTARILVAGAVAAVSLAAAARRWPPDRALYWCFGTALLLGPTLHPWYVLWILPFAALSAAPAWILLSGLVFLGYWGRDAYFATGHWPQPAWLVAAIHVPVLLLLLREGIRGLREGGHALRSG